jgi:hypothetical protein
MGTSCYEQWIGPLISNEIRLLSNEILIYQAISFVNQLTKHHENHLNSNYLIFNVIFNIIDNFMIFHLWIIDTCHYLC